MKTIEQYLEEVDYGYLNSPGYKPTPFALTFLNFIKLVNGKEGESSKTPPMHLAMLDKIENRSKDYVANLMFRGAGKSTIFIEYLSMYLAVFHELPGMKDVSGLIYVSDSMDNGVKNARQNIEHRFMNSEFMQSWITDYRFTENFITFKNKEGHEFGMRMYGARTGIRGNKIFGKRPTIAVLDDLIGDKGAESAVEMQLIEDTVYKGVNYALDPTNKLVIFCGTPFNKEDILVKAVESGGWEVNVWPVCEEFPVEKENFHGAWEDRFSYEYVKQQYQFSLDNGKVAAFNQEMMLRLTSDDERLVRESDIMWYSKQDLLKYKYNYNFYITTDFAVADTQHADYSVIFVWAYSNNGDWLLVDGCVERQTMNRNMDKLFELVQAYGPQQVGVEVTGQQLGFVDWINDKMIQRNIWFNLASSANGKPGIRPLTNKLARFNRIQPQFRAHKIYFPKEDKGERYVAITMGQIALVTQDGIKGKDDCIDAISMLGYFRPWKPSKMESGPSPTSRMMWYEDESDQPPALDSYLA